MATEKETLFAYKLFDSFLQNLQEYVQEEDENLILEGATHFMKDFMIFANLAFIIYYL